MTLAGPETSLTFPPLMWGEAVQTDAIGHGARRAALGCDAGLVTYIPGSNLLEAAIVFAPEVPLSDAMVMLPLCGIGFQNALGALAPPEVAVHLTWDGAILVNGATCGSLTVLSATSDADAVPDWLVVGLRVPVLPPEGDDGGHAPDQTALYAEGCADVRVPDLIEAWARHTLNWVTRWEADRNRPLHGEWRGLVHGLGEPIERNTLSGTFLGVDEDFGMLLRDTDGKTHLIPLTTLLETNP